MPSFLSARRALRRPRPTVSGRRGRVAASLACGLLVGTAVQLALPPPTFRAAASVAPEAGGARSTADLRQLADFAMSRSVLQAAASALVARGDAPLPGPLERLGAIRLDGEADRVARLAEQLAAAGHAAPGGDALLIGAEAGDATRAARFAQALADAFLVKRADAAATAQRTRESELASRIAAAEATAAATRKRFLAAGGADAGVEKARASAAAEVRDAEARIARLRGVLASGTPPVADDGSATQAISDLQANYLDLQGKLAQALQTLGERHTTVITLRDSIRRTGAELTAAWTRQLRSAEADRDAAKLREAALFRNDPGRDAGKQAALEEARRAKEAADAALLRAEAELDFLPDQPVFALRSAALVPARAAGGWYAPSRAAASLTAASATIALLLGGRGGLGRRRKRSFDPREAAAPLDRLEPIPMPGLAAANDEAAVLHPAAPPVAPEVPPASIDVPIASVWAAPPRPIAAPLPLHAVPPEQPASVPSGEAVDDAAAALAALAAPAARFFRAAAAEARLGAENTTPSVAHVSASTVPPPVTAAVEQLAAILDLRRPAASETAALHDLDAGFRGLVEELRRIVPANGPIPTLMIAASPSALPVPPAPSSATTDVALALGEVAAATGLRVLLVEATRECGSLASHAAGERSPSLVGMRDGLRLVFAADAVADLFLAPLFTRRAALVAALSRHRRARIVDEVAARYDLLIIDGGDAAAAARAGWTADRYLAVGREATLPAHARFLAALGHPAGDFAGTVVDATFVPPPRSGTSSRAGLAPSVETAAAA